MFDVHTTHIGITTKIKLLNNVHIYLPQVFYKNLEDIYNLQSVEDWSKETIAYHIVNLAFKVPIPR